MGTAIATGVIAIAGALLGSIMTGRMQRRITEDAHAAAERAALRREQIAAVAAVAAGAADHRRTSYRRRVLEQRGATAEELAEAKDDAYRTRSAMAQPLALVRLLIPHQAVRVAVDQLVATTFGLREAPDLAAGREASIAAHDRFLDTAAAVIGTAAVLGTKP
ncbi:protein kilB [Streptomyces sp. NPDC049879]|uniref:protein kilB n=1 Tax=Streptomyces sp. NPDC049879 TaxID=3365598 RepID=UPI00379FCBED